MGIRFFCEHCDRKLNIKSFLAGKKGICPHCSGKIIIPLESQIPSKGGEKDAEDDAVVTFLENNAKGGATTEFADLGGDPKEAVATPIATVLTKAKPIADALPSGGMPAETPAANDPFDEDPDAVWYVRPPTGGQYGPADGEVMRKWVSEGRVSADSLVWRDGWPDWRNANEEIPALGGKPTPPATGMVARPKTSNPTTSVNSEPSKTTSSSTSTSSSRRRGQGRDNSWIGMATIIGLGVLVLILGIVLIMLVVSGGDSDENESTSARVFPRNAPRVVDATF